MPTNKTTRKSRKTNGRKAAPKKNGAGRWGKNNERLSREPSELLARFQEQEAARYEKIVRIQTRAEKLGDKKTATAAKKIAKKLQSFAAA